MARTRRLRRNFEERGSRIEDTDAASRARDQVGRQHPPGRPRKPGQARDEGAPEAPVRLRGETVGIKRRRRPAPRPPRAADRQRMAHERPPREPLPQRPDIPHSPESDWRPSDGNGGTPTEHTPSLAGFSLTAALLTIPISAVRFFVNLGVHACYAVIGRLWRGGQDAKTTARQVTPSSSNGVT